MIKPSLDLLIVNKDKIKFAKGNIYIWLIFTTFVKVVLL